MVNRCFRRHVQPIGWSIWWWVGWFCFSVLGLAFFLGGGVIWIWIVIFFKAKRLGSPSFHDCSKKCWKMFNSHPRWSSTAVQEQNRFKVVFPRAVCCTCYKQRPPLRFERCATNKPCSVCSANKIGLDCILIARTTNPLVWRTTRSKGWTSFPAQKTWPGSQQPKWASTYYRWKEEWNPAAAWTLDWKSRKEWTGEPSGGFICILELLITPAHLGVCQVGLSEKLGSRKKLWYNMRVY